MDYMFEILKALPLLFFSGRQTLGAVFFQPGTDPGLQGFGGA
jgi:hypothetical protein